MQIGIEKFSNKVILNIDLSNTKDRNIFLQDLKENMNMYSGGLYTKLRFVLGVVHNGYYEVNGEILKITFTTNEKYIDDIHKEVEVYLEEFSK